MAFWSAVLGFEGVAKVMYSHSDEERDHMLRIAKFINEKRRTRNSSAFCISTNSVWYHNRNISGVA
jgi:ferritin